MSATRPTGDNEPLPQRTAQNRSKRGSRSAFSAVVAMIGTEAAMEGAPANNSNRNFTGGSFVTAGDTVPVYTAPTS